MNKKKNPRKHHIDIQRVYKSAGQPGPGKIRSWIGAALADSEHGCECVVRIVDTEESADLNRHYRHKSGPTNVLSFPLEWPDEIVGMADNGIHYLGDLVICASVVEREAIEQHKTLENHWAHIVIHGVLHLLGYDHIADDEAEVMESKEIAILEKLNINNPYIEVMHE